MKNLDKYRGCLIGGAAGDALGYAVEFLSEDSIVFKYGENGITEYDLKNGKALISDDTQMTLFTANGLLYAVTRGMMRGIVGNMSDYVACSYNDWLITQMNDRSSPEAELYLRGKSISWLMNVPELWAKRAPGGTCLSALESGRRGTVDEPINDSKGCGGVMRSAPVGLYLGEAMSLERADMAGAEIAALTHGHELGYIPAAMLVHIISLVSHDDNIRLIDAVKQSVTAIQKLFPEAVHLSELISLIQKAVLLSASNMDDTDAVHQLGQGWVAEETLAIAVYCSLKYEHDFEKALIAAVNHGGDSDSTGAVCGNILGAYLGMSAIPEKFLNDLELKDVILEIADDLYNDCKMSEYSEYRDEVWVSKYIRCDHNGGKTINSGS